MAEPVDVRIGLAGLGLGLTVGLGVGYFVAKKRLELKYDKLAQTEIDEARTYYRAATQAAETRLKEPLNEVVEYLGYTKKEEDVPAEDAVELEAVQEEPEEEPVNVFEGAFEDEWDYAVEVKNRTPELPYIIHIDEFGEEDREQVHYTFYDDDEILADEQDEPIDNVDELVGLENLQHWGHGTGNVNVLLIRNETLNLDIEITRSLGNYAVDVQGFLQHNYGVEKMRRRHPKFDDDDAYD